MIDDYLDYLHGGRQMSTHTLNAYRRDRAAIAYPPRIATSRRSGRGHGFGKMPCGGPGRGRAQVRSYRRRP